MTSLLSEGGWLFFAGSPWKFFPFSFLTSLLGAARNGSFALLCLEILGRTGFNYFLGDI